MFQNVSEHPSAGDVPGPDDAQGEDEPNKSRDARTAPAVEVSPSSQYRKPPGEMVDLPTPARHLRRHQLIELRARLSEARRGPVIKMPHIQILLCEDSQLIRRRLRDALQALPNVSSMFEAEDTVSSMECIRQNAIRIVILDLKLKNSSGLDLLSCLGEMDRPPSVLVFTNSGSPEIRAHVLRSGAVAFFDKSNGIDPLMDHLASLVAQMSRA